MLTLKVYRYKLDRNWRCRMCTEALMKLFFIAGSPQ